MIKTITKAIVAVLITASNVNAVTVQCFSNSAYNDDSDYDLFIHNNCKDNVNAYVYENRSGIEEEEHHIIPGELRHIASFPHGKFKHYKPQIHIDTEYWNDKVHTEFTYHKDNGVKYDSDKVVKACGW